MDNIFANNLLRTVRIFIDQKLCIAFISPLLTNILAINLFNGIYENNEITNQVQTK